MRHHFLTYLIFLILSVFSFENVKGQVLDTAVINLSPGGYINDVIFDQSHNSYIIVGNFIMVDNHFRKNIAFIDATTMEVKTESYFKPIQDMDGEIRCVELTKTFTLGVFTYHLFIGGNFSYINTGSGNITRLGIAKLVASQTSIPPSHSNFTVNAWNAEIDMTPLLTGISAEGVDDILITNDTVIFSGSFMAVNEITGWTQRDGIAAYLINGSTPLNYPLMATGPYDMSRYYCIRKKGANLYAGGYINGGGLGKGRLFKMDSNGNKILSFNYDYSVLQSVYAFDLVEDSLIFVADDRNSSNGSADCFFVVRQSNGTDKTNHSLYPASNNLIGNVAGPVNSMCVYDQNVYVKTGGAGEYIVGVESESTGPVINSPDWNALVPSTINTNIFGNVHTARNKLFISSTNLTTLSGQSRIRLGAYCLPPKTVNTFTSFDTTVCSGQTITYSLQLSDYADGYKWEYTGNGAFLVGHGYLTSPIELDGISQNSKQITFQPDFSPGILKVTPYTLCNGITKVYGKTVSLNIHSNPLPHVNAGNDTTITCYNDTTGIQLYGYSDSVVSSYEWVYNFPYPNIVGQTQLVDSASSYVFRVQSPLGCFNYDTVIVTMNTAEPNVTLPPPPYLLTCAITSQTYSGSSTTPNTTLQWYQTTDQYFPDPYTVTAPGQYFLEVTDNTNGCKEALGINVDTDYEYPNIQIAGYTSLNITQPIDTLTCIQPLLNLTCFSDSSNTTTEWMEQDTSAFYGNTLSINSGGSYFIFATDSDNGCTSSLGINIAEFFTKPGVGTGSGGELNCSVDSLILFGGSLTPGATVEWSGGSISPSSNPVTIYNAGTYYITATNPVNGCTNTDSVIIAQTNSIEVDAGNDTLVCKNESVNLNVNYTGTISGISYFWNNGSSTSNANFTGGDTPIAIAEVFGDGGCYGIDTVEINIPPVPVISFEGFKPCDDGPSGQIVATPVSGLSPFSFSIDNGNNFQTSPVFTGLYIGTYPILVHDSIQCEYNFTATIDENSSLPVPSFLFSTYNFETDTVVIIDVSNPPADSTSWIFPNPVIVLDDNAQNPMILLPDTGAFSITMQAYYGNCLVEISKIIYASPFDSLNATMYNLNGIKSIELYPNPTSGNFTVEVEFYKTQRSAMLVQDMIANTYFFEEYDESLIITQDIFLDLSVLDGTYVLKVVSEFDSASITFILAR
ncbi:MAG: hypothetical protein IPM77_01995 [Crocinitomicaceae bacterium]|nr:hypothetical protein [Crocinitomicaceae bacterium]